MDAVGFQLIHPGLEGELPASVPSYIPALRLRRFELKGGPPSLEEVRVLYQGYLGKAADFPPEDVHSEIEVFFRLFCEGLQGGGQADGLVEQQCFATLSDAVAHYHI